MDYAAEPAGRRGVSAIRSVRWTGVLLAVLAAACLPCAATEPDWHDYAALLAAHVTAGRRNGITLNLVDYGALATDPRLASALATLQSYPLAKLAGQREWLAFHINAYNLLALKMVVEHQPVQSIKDIGNFLRPVWQRNAGQLDGEAVSLADIEHRRLRKQGDARIHFAIVCASVSCPDLRTEPYRGATLDTQLNDQVTRFLANPDKGLRVARDGVHVSQIFDWFEDDFSSAGGVASFIARYLAVPSELGLAADIDYDWHLNGE